MRSHCAFSILMASLAAASLFAESPGTGDKPGPQPSPAGGQSASPRDAASGLATGKRMHKPLILRATEEAFDLSDGRRIILDKETGRVRFGDGEDGKKPPSAKVVDGSYRTGNGRTLVVKDARLLPAVTPTPPK